MHRASGDPEKVKDADPKRDVEALSESEVASEDYAFQMLAAEEEGHDIKFRTLSWQKATLLLFGEYVCLAILALPWSYSVLGWAVGLIVQVGMGFLTWCKCLEGKSGRGRC